MNIFNHKFFKGNLLTLFALVCCLILSSPLSANAAELPVSSSKASYDLAKGARAAYTAARAGKGKQEPLKKGVLLWP